VYGEAALAYQDPMPRPHLNLEPSLARLKIFPLPTVVLLPGAVLPLHIFEPRYRALVTDALASDRIMAMAMFEPGWEVGYPDRPTVRPICGVGRIDEVERLDDGRFNIRLVGLARAEILEELSPRAPYREVRARLPDEPTAVEAGAAETLRHAVLSLGASNPNPSTQVLVKAAAALGDPGDLADVCVAALTDDVATRQRVLEALSVPLRLQLALDVVGEALLQLGTGRPDGARLN